MVFQPVQTINNSNEQKFVYLAERAHTLLTRVGGPVDERTLLKHVFGVAGDKLDLWSSLILQVMGSDARFRRFQGDCWGLVSFTGGKESLLTLPVVVFDSETTGLDARRQRLIEYAAVCLGGDNDGVVLTSLLNPHRRVPRYITALTGINNEDLLDAPEFASQVAPLTEIFSDLPLVGHNISFDLEFLNAERGRLNLPPLTNRSIDTLQLAVRLFPRLRKPSLDRLAAHLGIPVTATRHRALADARLTATCFKRLLHEAEGRIQTFEELRAFLGGGEKSNREGESSPARLRQVFKSEWLVNIPHKPGVYLMHDEHDAVVYVGKAKNLRDRVGSYYTQPLGYTRKMDGLAESVRRIETRITGSELEALLLESRLIKEYLPRYNIQQRNYEHYPFIKISMDDPFPRIFASREIESDGARYFGPFRSARAVRVTIETLLQLFPVRSCTYSFNRKRKKAIEPCLLLGMKRCLGPCTGKVTREAYMQVINEIEDVLLSSQDRLIQMLWKRLYAASDRLDYEQAAKLRNAIHEVEKVLNAQAILSSAVERTHVCIILPSATEGLEVLCIIYGRLEAQLHIAPGDEETSIGRLKEIWEKGIERGEVKRVIGQEMIDEMNIIVRWLYQHRDEHTVVPLGLTPGEETWQTLQERLCAVPATPTPTVNRDDRRVVGVAGF